MLVRFFKDSGVELTKEFKNEVEYEVIRTGTPAYGEYWETVQEKPEDAPPLILIISDPKHPEVRFVYYKEEGLPIYLMTDSGETIEKL